MTVADLKENIVYGLIFVITVGPVGRWDVGAFVNRGPGMPSATVGPLSSMARIKGQDEGFSVLPVGCGGGVIGLGIALGIALGGPARQRRWPSSLRRSPS